MATPAKSLMLALISTAHFRYNMVCVPQSTELPMKPIHLCPFGWSPVLYGTPGRIHRETRRCSAGQPGVHRPSPELCCNCLCVSVSAKPFSTRCSAPTVWMESRGTWPSVSARISLRKPFAVSRALHSCGRFVLWLSKRVRAHGFVGYFGLPAFVTLGVSSCAKRSR